MTYFLVNPKMGPVFFDIEVLMIIFRFTLATLAMFTQLYAARFINVDPERENHSPYLYVGNQPLIAIDPDGKNAKVVIDEKQKTSTKNRALLFYSLSFFIHF